jgi:adenylate cyclase
MERKLTAIFCADVFGYSRLTGDDEEATHRTLRSYRKLIDALIEQHRGRFVHSAGDSVLAEFPSVVNAVQCALEIQTTLKAEHATLPAERRMEFRIGINLGDVIADGVEIYGDGVNVAARLESLADPGAIFISGTVREHLGNKLPLGYTDLGEREVKNIARPVRVFRVWPEAGAAEQSATKAQTTRKYLRRAVFSVVAPAIIAATIMLVRLRSPAPVPAESGAAARRTITSIAVLPLDNYSGDPNQEYFADGMTDELTTDLATISALRVISRGSVMRFKGANRPPTPEIAKMLNVDAVVEGSVVRVADRVRITAQLIDGSTDQHLWAESFERDSPDVLALQDDLASAIAQQINVQLTPSERARLSSAPTVIPEAHDAYLKGRYFFYRPTDENLLKAIAQFKEAIRLDPNFAPAYAGLSDAYLWLGFNEDVLTSAQAMPLVKSTAQKALQLDDNSAEAHTSLAVFKMTYEFNWADAEREFHRAIELNSNYPFAHDQFGLALAWQGRLDEAWPEHQRAMELDPLSPEILFDAAGTLLWQGRYAAAKDLSRRLREIDPTLYLSDWEDGWIDIERGKVGEAIPELEQANAMESPPPVAAFLGYAYGASGNSGKSHAMIDELNRRSLHGYVDPFYLAMVYLGMEDREHALNGLEEAYAANSQWMVLLKVERIFDPLRAEPRFIALLKKVHLDN